MAQNENKGNKPEVVKKENFIKRGWKWTTSHKRDIGLGVALTLSVLNTAFIVMANIDGIGAEIDSEAVDAMNDGDVINFF